MKQFFKILRPIMSLRFACILLISLSVLFANAQPCTPSSSFNYVPGVLGLPGVLTIHTGCIKKVVRYTYRNGVADVSWSGVTDANGDIAIVTSDAVSSSLQLSYTDVDNVAARQIEADSKLPPGTASYTGQFDGIFNPPGNALRIILAEHSTFSKSEYPPIDPTILKIESFTSTAKFNLEFNGVPTIITAPADVSIDLKLVDSIGTKKYYINEITKLDITGGNLPPTTLIRESPTEESTGVTIIDSVLPPSPTPGKGNAVASQATIYIQSYFDIRTEISLDSGLTWTPSEQTGLMIMQDPVNMPTLSKWGLILMAVLILATSLFFLARK